jgi:hypothetical protein
MPIDARVESSMKRRKWIALMLTCTCFTPLASCWHFITSGTSFFRPQFFLGG